MGNWRGILIFIISLLVFFFLVPPGLIRAAGFALNFDGVDDYVDCGNILNFAGRQPFTILVWVLPSSSLQDAALIDRVEWSPIAKGYVIYVSSVWLMYERYVDGVEAGFQQAFEASNVWTHIAAIYDGEKMKLYLNGLFMAETEDTRDLPEFPRNLTFGAYSDFSSFLNGALDEMRIYNRALTAQEAEEAYKGNFENEAGLVGLWHFDEGSGDIAYDTSGQGHNGTIFGATWIEREVTPQPGEAFNTYPEVKLKTEISGTYRGLLSFSYSASDPDSGPGALKSQPMIFYYCNEEGFECNEIAKDQANTGSYDFDTTKVPDGNYKIRIVAMDNYGAWAEAFSKVFTIDNTGPTFDISVSPTPLIKEKDIINLKIISSEKIKAPPKLKISQQSAPQPISVEVRGSGKEFYASSSLLRGFPGKATISISGEDLVGNIGEIITSGAIFFIEQFGPPPPKIKEPVNNQVFTQSLIKVLGLSQLNVRILLTLNGVTKFTTQTSIDGSFQIENIFLSTANKGYNTLSIFGFNEKNEQSGEVVLKVKLNKPPKITITSSFEEIISGEKEITWVASDLNDDKLVFSIDYSNDEGVTWGSIVSDLLETSYKVDTTQIADGDNYLLRVTADDGTEKVSSLSPKFTIKNNLPHISLDIPANYFTNTSTPRIRGQVSSPMNEIVSVEYSLDGGKTWQEAKIIERSPNALREKFEISTPTPLSDGKYVLLIRVKDISNHSVKISRTFNIDTLPPVTQIIRPSLEEPVNSDMDTNLELEGFQMIFEGKSEPEARIEFILEETKYEIVADKNGDFSIKDVNLKSHGFNNFSLSSVDLAENTFQMTNKVISNKLPEITALNLKEGDFLGGIKEINWQVKDLDNDPLNAQILYQKKDEEWISLIKKFAVKQNLANVYKWNLSKLNNGDYKIKLIINDGLNEIEKVLDIFVDNVFPSVEFTILGPRVTKNVRPTFSGKASDDFSGIQYVEYSLDNINWYKGLISKGYQELTANFDFKHRFSLKDGNYKIQVRVSDRAGNTTYSEPFNLTIDTIPPRIGSNLISSGALIIFPDEEGISRLFRDKDYQILISVAGEAKEVELRSGKIVFNLNFNNTTLLWESKFNFKEAADCTLEIKARDEAGNSQTKEIAKLKVLSPGYVYNEKNNQPIKGAKITLYIFDEISNDWLIWDGGAFDQKNPQETSESGEYNFLVPPGKYKLEVSHRRYETVISKELEVKKNYLMLSNIPLTEKKGIFDRILELFQ